MTSVLELKRPHGGATPTTFRLPGCGDKKTEIKVGRNGDVCDIFLYVDEHPSFLSRVHACFKHRQGFTTQRVTEEGILEESSFWWEVIDHGSVNGVFVNGDRLEPDTPRQLKQGDRIFFGNPAHSFFLEYEFKIYPPGSKEAAFFSKQPISLNKGSRRKHRRGRSAPPRTREGSNTSRTERHRRNTVEGLQLDNPEVLNELQEVLRTAPNSNPRLLNLLRRLREDAERTSLEESATRPESARNSRRRRGRSSSRPIPDDESERIRRHTEQTFRAFIARIRESGDASFPPPASQGDASAAAAIGPSVSAADGAGAYTATVSASVPQLPGCATDSRPFGVGVVNPTLVAQSNPLIAAQPPTSPYYPPMIPHPIAPVNNLLTTPETLPSGVKRGYDSLIATPSSEDDVLSQVMDITDDTDLETGGAPRRKRPHLEQDSANANVKLFSKVTKDVWAFVCTFFDLSEIFQMREVCQTMEQRSNEILLQVDRIRWDYRWNQDFTASLLKRCANATKIDAAGVYCMFDAYVEQIAASLPHLKHLNLSGCSRISTKAMHALASSCTELESLRLRACKRIATPEAAASLTQVAKNCKNLQSLDLRCANLEDKALISLLNECPNLRVLDCGSTGFSSITDQVLFAIEKNCRNLEALHLMCARSISNAGVEAVARGCGETLEKLTLHCVFELTNVSLVHLARHCKKLKLLNVHRCFKLSDYGIEELAKGCGNSLENLDVSACKISDNAIQAIAASCPHLRVLDVRSCENLTSASIIDIARNCPLLEHVDLSGCKKLDDACVFELARHCRNLRIVEFGNVPKVTDAARQHLRDSFPGAAIYY